MAADPLPALRARLVSEGHATEEELTNMQEKIEKEVEEARDFGLESERPSLDELRRDVFAEEIPA